MHNDHKYSTRVDLQVQLFLPALWHLYTRQHTQLTGTRCSMHVVCTVSPRGLKSAYLRAVMSYLGCDWDIMI